MLKTYSYAALGDSYTVGEGVPLHFSFPYRVVQLMRKDGFQFAAPEIIARTGWTTDELTGALDQYRFLPKYDFATLLIGVNNQYRGRAIEEYKTALEQLLNKLLLLVDGKKDHAFLLSIPDYSRSPFAQNKETEKIAKDIDLFNSVGKALSVQYKVQYIDITTGLRERETDNHDWAGDGLHPSALELMRWAEKVAQALRSLIK